MGVAGSLAARLVRRISDLRYCTPSRSIAYTHSPSTLCTAKGFDFAVHVMSAMALRAPYAVSAMALCIARD
eukprot:3861660-Rhodomonas_salina.2